MADPEEDKQAEEREAAAEQRCPALMYREHRCGRSIHTAPPGVDEEPVCLMHSKDPDKSDAAFQVEFERILTDAGEGYADFTGFVFSSANYGGREFRAICLFNHATFTQDANFPSATFTHVASFRETVFSNVADFRWASFGRIASFERAQFRHVAYFMSATFTQGADFSSAVLIESALFLKATFARDANFMCTVFGQDADFSMVTFAEDADFSSTQVGKVASFESATFKRMAEFWETRFREDESLKPAAIFGLARFEKPELIVFYDTYLGLALFHNCNVSQFAFSSVRWRKRDNGKRMVLEEDQKLDLTGEVTKALRRDRGSTDERNYGLIAELYQQLKKNYDDKRDYWTAGDFHYGEMEMKRLSSPRRNPVLRWLHRNLGLAAWYKYASDYGESYVKPFLRLLLVLALFTFIYPACGLQRVSSEKGSPSRPVAQTSSPTTNTDEISYAKFSQFLSASPNSKLRGTVGFFVQSAMASVSVASLRRDFADFEPPICIGPFRRPHRTPADLNPGCPVPSRRPAAISQVEGVATA
jgi:uncharacterized protein YjbI with pentapeptide repeats